MFGVKGEVSAATNVCSSAMGTEEVQAHISETKEERTVILPNISAGRSRRSYRIGGGARAIHKGKRRQLFIRRGELAIMLANRPRQVIGLFC